MELALVMGAVGFSFGIVALVLSVVSFVFVVRGMPQRKGKESGGEENEDEARKSRAVEEGFENLMRFSVRGKDGFGGKA